MVEQETTLEMTLEAYLKATRTTMWASQGETAIAINIEKTLVLIKIKNASWAPSDIKPKFDLLLKDGHYYVQRMRKKRQLTKPSQEARAGVKGSAWTNWQYETDSYPSIDSEGQLVQQDEGLRARDQQPEEEHPPGWASGIPEKNQSSSGAEQFHNEPT